MCVFVVRVCNVVCNMRVCNVHVFNVYGKVLYEEQTNSDNNSDK